MERLPRLALRGAVLARGIHSSCSNTVGCCVLAILTLVGSIIVEFVKKHQEARSPYGLLLIVLSLGFFGGAQAVSFPERQSDSSWGPPRNLLAFALAMVGVLLLIIGLWLLRSAVIA